MDTTTQSRVPPPWAIRLPDNKQWENRFKIQSEDGTKCYIIAQNKKKRHWGCSCASYRFRRYCKHLDGLLLPGLEKPYEP